MRAYAYLSLLMMLLGANTVQARQDWDEADYQEVFRCESKDKRQSYCRLDVHADVVLVNQISRNPCIEGSTWGFDGRGVWVSQGCRADFAIVRRGRGRGNPGRDERGYGRDDRGYERGLPDADPRGGRGGGYAIRCESRDQRYNHCDAPVRGRVEISRRLSDTRCDYGQTWGYDRRGVWVDRGCRAEFVIYD